MFLRARKSKGKRPVRLGRGLFADAPSGSRLDNPRFVSFLSRNNPAPGHSDRHDARLRRKKRLKTLGLVALSSFATWVALESATALTLF